MGVVEPASYPFFPLLVGCRLPVGQTARSTSTVEARSTAKERGILHVGGDIVRVAVVDDQRLLARGIAGIVDEQPDMETVGQAHDGEKAVTLCQREEPAVVLMDISMPKMDGIRATRELRDLLPGTAILILTSSEEDEHVFEGIKAGASGYLLKDCTPEELAHAIRTIHSGQTVMAPGRARKMLAAFEGANVGAGGSGSARLALPLTERELEVIRALARGRTDRKLAKEVGISEKTVDNHTSPRPVRSARVSATPVSPYQPRRPPRTARRLTAARHRRDQATGSFGTGHVGSYSDTFP